MLNIVINRVVEHYFTGKTVRESITSAVKSLDERQLFKLKEELEERRNAR